MESKAGPDIAEDENIALLLDEVYRVYGYDFRDFAESFLKRRIMHRLALSGMGSLSELRRRVAMDRRLFSELRHDLSIGVTEMFRDPPFFRALREVVFPCLRAFPFLRIWDAGCATGEETYSLGILLKEEGLSDRSRIYATDFNDDALETARGGIFPLRHLKKYSGNYLKSGGAGSLADYFNADSEHAIFDAALKRNILFCNHNMITDGVFNEMHLILCRNVLIYFNQQLQERVVGLFGESLCRRGFLCLGSQEKLRPGREAQAFEDRSVGTARFYQKRGEALPPHPPSPLPEAARPPDKDAGRRPFEAVVIGTSAGGVGALGKILSLLEPDFPLPLVVVMHLHETSERMPEILGRSCRFRVKYAEDKEKIEPGTVYLAPPSYHLMVETDRSLSLVVFEKVRHARPSIDVLFESAANVFGKAVIGVILTGANQDGSSGLAGIRREGGVAIVQDPEEALHDTMPRAALGVAGADAVLRLGGIGAFLARIGRGARRAGRGSQG